MEYFLYFLTFFIGVMIGLLIFSVKYQQMLKDKKKAEEGTKLKNEFLAKMSHEIRTPMNSIVGMTTVLLDTNLNSKQLNYLHTIQSSCDVLLGVINDILDFSKIEAGKLELEEIPFFMEHLINDVIDLFIFKAEEKELKLDVTYENEFPKVLIGDPIRIKQIIINLVSNAIKFTQTGSVNITLKYEESLNKKCLIRCMVKDTGVGIPENKLKKLFQEYSQADASINRFYGGSGLGLAICSKLISLMRGNIDVKSTIGRGTEFNFYIELIKGTEADGEKLKNCINEDLECMRTFNKDLKVLVVDDNALNLKVAQLLLNHMGLQVETATNGEKAIQLIQEKHIDIIFMDMYMPIMNGLEATEYIRKNMPEQSHLYIVAMTAAATTEDRRNCLEAGMNDYITKPFKEEAIINILKKLRTKTP